MGKVEEIARAIAWANNEDDFGRMSEEVKELYREQARAAIRAMLEPTKEMLEAGMAHEATDLASEYRAMIDAALSEPICSASPTATHESRGG